VKFIKVHRAHWGIEPICTALQVAPSTYYAAVSRQASARQRSDERLKTEIGRVHRDNFGVYGIDKVWRQLDREGIKIGRDRVARLMDDLELSGVYVGRRSAPRFQMRSARGRPTWSNATSPQPHRVRCGWPT
jgi:putative transposase